MTSGLFMITVPSETVFKLGLATIIAGNGLFKPNISTMVGKLYGATDERRDSGFTIFCMGINAGAFIGPILTGGLILFWTLFAVYIIQTTGELCLSPIGLSMVTKLAPERLVGFGMGGWFLSTGIGNNLSGILAGSVSGEAGMTTDSALAGYTFGFWALVGAGVVLFLIAPLIQRIMHGVK